MKCIICDKELNQNHLRIHGISRKEYYDTYIKLENEGFCLDCKIPTRYTNFYEGYNKRCNLCANREIGNNKKENYKKIWEKREEIEKQHKITKICKICNKEFVTDNRLDKEICNSVVCRRNSPTDPKQIDEIKFFNNNECPYCGIFYKKYNVLFFHLTSHFPADLIETVFEYLWDNIWKKERPKCKNPVCNNKCEKKRLDTFLNFCKECRVKKEFSGSNAIKYIYTKEEIEKYKKRAIESIKKFYVDLKNSDDTEKKEKFRSQWNDLGKKNSIRLKDFYKTDVGKSNKKLMAAKQSVTMKRLIAEGRFTPNITNSWTHWESSVDINGNIVRFRSSWEACFYLCNNNLEYEIVRIPYIDDFGHNRTTVVDFFDKEKNILYEVKPTSIFIIQKTKMDAVIEYCLKNKIKFIWINENNILNYVDKTKFLGDNLLQYDKMMKGIKNEGNINKKNNETS